MHLHLEEGSAIVAAESPLPGQTTGYNGGVYDAAEPKTEWDAYQDYGHNHWQNSLMWGTRSTTSQSPAPASSGAKASASAPVPAVPELRLAASAALPRMASLQAHPRHWSWATPPPGASRGNYPIYRPSSPASATRPSPSRTAATWSSATSPCSRAATSALLLTGVDNLTIDNLKIDTDRDGIDIDCCQNVRVSNCTVNSPWDDGICPKSSYALGYARPTRNVTITNC